MSWDVLIFASKSPPPPLDQWSHDFSMSPLGDAAAVRQQISLSLTEVDWSDQAWGRLRTEQYSIAFNFQDSGEVEAFMLHVHGGGDPLEVIYKLCRDTGWYALDTSSGEIIDTDRPSKVGWNKFQAYRDFVIRKVQSDQQDSTSDAANEEE